MVTSADGRDWHSSLSSKKGTFGSVPVPLELLLVFPEYTESWGETRKLSCPFMVVERQRASTVKIRKCHAPHKNNFMLKAVLGFHI